MKDLFGARKISCPKCSSKNTNLKSTKDYINELNAQNGGFFSKLYYKVISQRPTKIGFRGGSCVVICNDCGHKVPMQIL